MSWERFTQHYLELQELDFAIDISRIDFGDDFLAAMEPKIQAAYQGHAGTRGRRDRQS